MNLRYKALGLVAALGLSFAMVAPAMADATTSQSISVTLNEGGAFSVSVDEAELNGASTSALTGEQVVPGHLLLHYHDTESYRNGFDVTLYADDFTSDTPIPYTTPAANYSIPASNLAITRNYDTVQGRCSCPSGGGPRIGDIGPTSHGNDNDHSGGPYDPANEDLNIPNFRYHDWTVAGLPNTTLESDTPPLVGFGFEGPGTASSALDGSTHYLAIALTVPAGQPAEVYTSTLHVTVTFGWNL